METVLWEVRDGVGVATLNRPERLNAVNNELTERLLGLVRAAGEDDAIRALLITGSGRAFSAGGDITTILGDGRSREEQAAWVRAEMVRIYNPLTLAIRELEKPVVAAVNGPAAGIALSWALASDLVLMADDAYLLQPFTGIGVLPDGGAAALLAARVGAGRATELMFLARRLPAADALAWGAVNAIHPTASLLDEAHALAQRLAVGPTRAYGAIKRAVNASTYAGLAEHLELEAQLQEQLLRTDDAVGAMQAFLDKRPPSFAGR